MLERLATGGVTLTDLLPDAWAKAHPVQEVRDVIERQISYMRLIIDDIVDTSRIAQNKLQLRWHRY